MNYTDVLNVVVSRGNDVTSKQEKRKKKDKEKETIVQ